MNKKVIIFAVLFVLLIIAPIATNQYYNYQLSPNSKDQTQQIFVINPGQPLVQIAENLKEKGLIKNAFAFRLLVSQMGIGNKIQFGDFRLSSAMSSREIAQELTHGAIDVWVTIPEGLRIEEQAAKIEEKLKFGNNTKVQFNKQEYIKLAKEGYMFPDTYLLAKDATAEIVATRLNQTFTDKVSEKLLNKGKENNLSPDEVVILASLVEREAKTAQERPIIAGIIINRLNIGMPLQIDATVQYAKGYQASQNTWWPTITQQDYKSVKSLFNTYLYSGLPPKPISSPGLESIMAAAEPEATDYLYYLHDSEGKVHYAKTGEEHNSNIQNYIK